MFEFISLTLVDQCVFSSIKDQKTWPILKSDTVASLLRDLAYYKALLLS